uniref:Uncharacterized protein n=1 Tax=Rhizophora mucronata TaxID=61149 RepID=A0A2P2QGE1_RHIMU
MQLTASEVVTFDVSKKQTKDKIIV